MEETKTASLMCFKFREVQGFSMSLRINFNLGTHLFPVPPLSLYSLKNRNLISRFCHLFFSIIMKTRVFSFFELHVLTLKKKFFFSWSIVGFPSDTVVKNRPASTRGLRDVGSIPGWERSPRAGNGNCSSILASKIP